jgi:integrase
LEAQVGKHPQFCFTYHGAPIRWDVTNTAWHNALEKAGLSDVRFHDLLHTWASWSAGRDELRRAEGPGGMEVAQHGGPVREIRDRNLAGAAARIERGEHCENVRWLRRFCYGQK